MKTCAAFARRGHEVVLVAKQGDDNVPDDHAHYGIANTFEITKVARPSRRGGGLVYAAGMARCVLGRRRWADVVYCRDPLGAVLATELHLPTVFEAHEVPQAPWLRRVLARALRQPNVATVAITDALRRDLLAEKLQPPTRPIIIAPDACDPPSHRVVAHACGTPPTVGYVGSLYPGRGIDTIVALAREMPDVRFSVVGGSEQDLAHWRALAPSNVVLHGFRPQAALPALYATFDVVIMPHATTGVLGATKSADISRWTSPMKMFEYMASGVPLVASSLPVLQEVLRDGHNALIVPDTGVPAWAAALRRLFADDALRFRLADTAQRELVQRYTWDARAATILEGLAAHMNGDA